LENQGSVIVKKRDAFGNAEVLERTFSLDKICRDGGTDAIVKGFGCRPMTDGAANSAAWGRRPKASKEGNRGKGYEMGCGARYGDLRLARWAVDGIRRERSR
jgi:hypothetical protein